MFASTRQYTGASHIHRAYVYDGNRVVVACNHDHVARNGVSGQVHAQRCADRMLDKIIRKYKAEAAKLEEIPRYRYDFLTGHSDSRSLIEDRNGELVYYAELTRELKKRVLTALRLRRAHWLEVGSQESDEAALEWAVAFDDAIDVVQRALRRKK